MFSMIMHIGDNDELYLILSLLKQCVLVTPFWAEPLCGHVTERWIFVSLKFVVYHI